MADRRREFTFRHFSALRVTSALTLAMTLSACNSAGQNVTELMSANQATQQARQSALEKASMRASSQNTVIPAPKNRPVNAQLARFRPDVQRMVAPTTTGRPGAFKQPVQLASLAGEAKPTPAAKAAAPVKNRNQLLEEQARPNASTIAPKLARAPRRVNPNIAPPRISDRGMDRFRRKLADLKAGRRTKPVTILHIGDSHVASDSFSRGIRRALQAEYGNAGRGAIIPARAFKYGTVDQAKQSRSGPWTSRTALRQKKSSYGISGVSVSSASRKAKMVMTPSGGLDYAEATVMTGPKQGKFTLTIGGKSETFNARASSRGTKTFRLDGSGKSVTLRPAGGGTTTVVHWASGKNTPGIRYVNFGLIGATVNITNRFNERMVADDVAALDPDLIVYGYGTNEGFNGNLNLKRYAVKMASYLNLLEKAASNADTLIIGAADGLRRSRRGAKACGGGWSIPRRMKPLRATMKSVAESRSAGYWSWSAAMGGDCSANRWAAKGLAARDRVHLTSKGYRRSAAKFAAWIAQGDGKAINVALQNN